MRKLIFCLLCLLSLIVGTLQAEIQQITVRWTSLLCKDSCVKTLDKELRKIKGIEQFNIDPSSGQVSITWKANVPFQFTTINTAMHMVGLSMRDIRIKVRGNILPSGNQIYIVSEGDNTRFELMNPVTPNPNGQSHVYNYTTRTLSPELKKQLLDGYQAKQIATVEGPVFMPERMTVPTQIVVDHLNFEVAKPQMKPAR